MPNEIPPGAVVAAGADSSDGVAVAGVPKPNDAAGCWPKDVAGCWPNDAAGCWAGACGVFEAPNAKPVPATDVCGVPNVAPVFAGAWGVPKLKPDIFECSNLVQTPNDNFHEVVGCCLTHNVQKMLRLM